MSVNNGDWQSPSFRQKVVMNIDDALKKSQNIIGSPKEKSASEIEEQIHGRSVNRDSYMSMVARIILHLQQGGQNQGQPAQTMNQGPMTPMMQNTNMQQSGQMMVPDPNALRTDSHLLPKMLAQPSPMSSISTPSPKIPLYHSPSPAPVQQVKQAKTSGVRSVQVSSTTAYPSPSPIIPSPSPVGHSPAPALSPAQTLAFKGLKAQGLESYRLKTISQENLQSRHSDSLHVTKCISTKDAMMEIQKKAREMLLDQFMKIEGTVSPYTFRPVVENISFDDGKFYNFLVFDLETSTLNIIRAEICQLSAIDHSGSYAFSKYVVPDHGIDSDASMVNKLTIEYINSERKLLKDGMIVATEPLDKVVKEFQDYISQSIERAKATTSKPIQTILIGHNASAFDRRILLRSGGKRFADELESMNVLFADSLILFRELVKCKYSTLENPDGTFPKLNQHSLYEALFRETFVEHGALEDATALHKMLFSSKLKLSTETIVDNARLVRASLAHGDMEYLDGRYERTFDLERLRSYSQSNADITCYMIEKIAGSGLTYQDLAKVFKRHGEVGLVAILSNTPSSSSTDKPRVTRTERILTAIVEHFQRKIKKS